MSRDRVVVTVGLLIVGLIGCTSFPTFKDGSSKGQKPPSLSDMCSDDDTEESWVREAGNEARGDRPIETDNDPLRNLFSSPRARSIERNLGIH